MATTESITLAGGCFWCLEAVYRLVDGVTAVESGYANGRTPAPSYEEVCSGTTGHAEVVRLSFDPQRITLRELLEIFFSIHDPTTLDRQGADVGTQYRSGIYHETAEQRAVAGEVLDELAASGAHSRPIVTELLPLASYYPAEAYHQRYFERHPGQGYCQMVVSPKVEKFRRSFARRYRPPAP